MKRIESNIYKIVIPKIYVYIEKKSCSLNLQSNLCMMKKRICKKKFFRHVWNDDDNANRIARAYWNTPLHKMEGKIKHYFFMIHLLSSSKFMHQCSFQYDKNHTLSLFLCKYTCMNAMLFTQICSLLLPRRKIGKKKFFFILSLSPPNPLSHLHNFQNSNLFLCIAVTSYFVYLNLFMWKKLQIFFSMYINLFIHDKIFSSYVYI
jgi:hypothetical protein